MQVNFSTINFQGRVHTATIKKTVLPVALAAVTAIGASAATAQTDTYTPRRSAETIEANKKDLKFILRLAAAFQETLSRKELAHRVGITHHQLNNMFSSGQLDDETLALYDMVKNKDGGYHPKLSKRAANSRIDAIKTAIERMSLNGERITDQKLAEETGLTPYMVKDMLSDSTTGLQDMKKSYNTNISQDKIKKDIVNIKTILLELTHQNKTVSMNELAEMAGLSFGQLQHLIYYGLDDSETRELYNDIIAQNKKDKIGAFHELPKEVLQSRIDTIKKAIETLSSKEDVITAQKIADVTGLSVHVIRRMIAYNEGGLNELLYTAPSKEEFNTQLAQDMVKKASVYSTNCNDAVDNSQIDDYTRVLTENLNNSGYDKGRRISLSRMFEYVPIIVDTILSTRDKDNQLREIHLGKIKRACNIDVMLTQELLAAKNKDNTFKYDCDEILNMVKRRSDYRY